MKRSTNVIVSNLSRDNILFSTFYTGLFLLFRKKTGGGHGAPPAPPLATALKVKCLNLVIGTLHRVQVKDHFYCVDF